MQLQSRPDSCCSSRDCQAKAASDQSLAIWRVATSALLLGREGSNRAGRSWTQGGSTSTDSATYAATSNRLLSVARGGQSRSLGYDGSGNVPADTRFDGTAFGYGYDGDGRLATVTRNALPEASYGYDAFQRRVLKTAGGLTRHFLYDPDGHLLAEATAAGATTTEYVWLGDAPLAMVADADTASPRLFWFHIDQLGTPQKLTDTSGNLAWDAVLEPFGELASLTVNLVAQPLRLPGQYADAETGLHQNWHRDYDPALGRYLQPDLLGVAAGSNLYLYAGGNPVSLADPDGRNMVLLVLGGGAIGAGIDVAWQLEQNGGKLACVDWDRTVEAAMLGAMCASGGWALLTSAGRQLLREFARDEMGGNPNRLRPLDGNNGRPLAEGPHSVFKRGSDGRATNYETYGHAHPRNPNRWQSEKRVDVTGAPHFNKSTGERVPTPHVRGRDVLGGVRPARPDELPRARP